MTFQGSTSLSALELTRRYIEVLQRDQSNGRVLNTVEESLVIQGRQDARTEELEHLQRRLEDEIHPASQAIQLLGDRGNSLLESWNGFAQYLSVDDLRKLDNRDFGWDDVAKAVEKIQASWLAKKEGIWGTARLRLNKVLQTMHSHKTFLKIIPKNEDYAAIVCGSLLVLMTASANYRKVAEGLARAFVEINEIVRLCNVDLQLYQGDHLVEMASTVYARIFEFLGRAMRWFTQPRARRFIKSFKEDVYEEFEDDIVEIRRLSESIRRRAQQSANVEARVSRLAVLECRDEVKESRRLMEQQRELLQEIANNLPREVGRHGTKLCISNAEVFLAQSVLGIGEAGDASGVSESPNPQNGSMSTLLANDPLAISLTLRATAKAIRRHWEGCQSLLDDWGGTTFVDIKVIVKLRRWIPSLSSYFLAIIGPKTTAAQSVGNQVAAVVASFAAQAGAPLIHASCSSSVDGPEGYVHLSEKECLSNLVTSLVGQLVDILPDDCNVNEDLSLSKLDGTEQHWSLAMHALSTLLGAASSPLFCIIDNWQSIEDPFGDNERLLELLQTFKEHSARCKASPYPRSLKVLITTSGRSHSLMDTFDSKNIILADQLSGCETPDNLKAGQSLLSPRFMQSFANMSTDEPGETDSEPEGT